MAEKATEIKFSKEAIVNSRRYAKYQDILKAVLQEGKQYTFSEAEKLIDTYMKGRVR